MIKPTRKESRLKKILSATYLFSHIIQFTTYNIAFALIPMAAALFIRNAAQQTTNPGIYAPELLFYTVTLCATTLSDITNELRSSKYPTLLQSLKSAMTLGVVGAAILYGAYQYGEIIGPKNTLFVSNIGQYAFWLAIILTMVSISTEILIANVRYDESTKLDMISTNNIMNENNIPNNTAGIKTSILDQNQSALNPLPDSLKSQEPIIKSIKDNDIQE